MKSSAVMNDVQFEFMGFNPDEKMRNFVSSFAEKLLFSAPSDAVLKLVLAKDSSAVRVKCRIASKSGIFLADSAGKDPVRAVQKIERKIDRQINDWRNRRFEESSRQSHLF
ncbi:MAG: hypothetical protein K2X47_06235 [Bdellovibrionales bacterium]|nr:hypothetical protein [Bdellovibrionales bacterium]